MVLVNPMDAVKLGCNPAHPFPWCFVPRWARFHKPDLGHTGSLLESEPRGDRPAAQQSSEESPFCSGLLCMDWGPPTYALGPVSQVHSSGPLPPSLGMCPPHFFPT